MLQSGDELSDLREGRHDPAAQDRTGDEPAGGHLALADEVHPDDDDDDVGELLHEAGDVHGQVRQGA